MNEICVKSFFSEECLCLFPQEKITYFHACKANTNSSVYCASLLKGTKEHLVCYFDHLRTYSFCKYILSEDVSFSYTFCEINVVISVYISAS